MGNVYFTDEFRCEAVAQIIDCGYSYAEISKRLGISQHSLYKYNRNFFEPKGRRRGDDTLRSCDSSANSLGSRMNVKS